MLHVRCTPIYIVLALAPRLMVCIVHSRGTGERGQRVQRRSSNASALISLATASHMGTRLEAGVHWESW